MTKWTDIWEVAPFEWEDILFKTGDEGMHTGILHAYEKLRKCKFYCYCCDKFFECDTCTPLYDRVTHWAELPEVPHD